MLNPKGTQDRVPMRIDEVRIHCIVCDRDDALAIQLGPTTPQRCLRCIAAAAEAAGQQRLPLDDEYPPEAPNYGSDP